MQTQVWRCVYTGVLVRAITWLVVCIYMYMHAHACVCVCVCVCVHVFTPN